MNAPNVLPLDPASRDASPSDQPQSYHLPRFDPAWLPEPMRWFAVSHAESLGVPLEMVALQALAAPALVAGPYLDVEARAGWREPAMLYTLTIADSGTGKSPAMRPFSRFIRAVERARQEAQKRTREEAAAELNKAIDAGGDELAVAAAKKKLTELKNAGEPNPRLYATDATDERLATMMKDGNGAAGVWSAEPKFFRVAGGAYSNGGPATDVMLQAYSGDEVRVERQTKPPVYVDRPRLTISMMSQRKPVEDFLDKTGHDERGELARFLMCSPPDWRGYITLGQAVPDAHTSLAEECMQRLGKLATSPPCVVLLTKQARERFEAWAAMHQRLQRPGGLWREPKEWVAKMPGLVLRLAGVIHAAESIMEAQSVARDLPLGVLERAIAIAEWGFSQACSVYRVSQQNSVSRRLDHLRAILKQEPPGLLRSELWKLLKSTCNINRAAQLDELLGELERCGELRREKCGSGPKGGRPGERVWLLDGFREGSQS